MSLAPSPHLSQPSPLEDADLWRCYFETAAGLVLTSPERFASPEAAASWGTALLLEPEGILLADPDDELVAAASAAPWAGVTVEPVDED